MDWKISKGGEACSKCEKPFEHDDTYYSTITVEAQSISRFDFCEACFGLERDHQSEVFWRTKKLITEPVKKAVNFEILRELFLSILEVEEKAFKEVAYLLALVLIRKRYLKLKDFISENGTDYMTVRQKKDLPLIKVEVPLLKEEDIAGLRGKLSDLLDADFDSSMDVKELRGIIADPEPVEAQPAPEAPPAPAE
jgi:hypothetical protein